MNLKSCFKASKIVLICFLIFATIVKTSIATETSNLRYALSFDGVDDYLRVPDNPSINFGKGQSFTLEAWIKLKPSNDYQTIVLKQSIAYFHFGLLPDGRLEFVIFDGTINTGVSSNKRVDDDTWHYVAAVRDTSKNEIYVYIDAELAGTAKDNTQDLSSSEDFYIGLNPYTLSKNPAKGIIDEVRISNVSRTFDFLLQIPSVDQYTIALWHFDEGIGQIAYDETSNHNDSIFGSIPEYDSNDPVWTKTNPPTIEVPTVIFGIYQIPEPPVGEFEEVTIYANVITLSNYTHNGYYTFVMGNTHLKNSNLYYSTDDGKSWKSVEMTLEVIVLDDKELNVWKATIPGQNSNSKVTFYIEGYGEGIKNEIWVGKSQVYSFVVGGSYTFPLFHLVMAIILAIVISLAITSREP